ncbi:MAG TPA: hypothetical protein VNV17_19345 [Solirubrobacteraceae bacterium]|jgi:hypothetical protein|nr:hypothetical protein [Solirubrobacteraceae bacterium]
MTATSVRPRRPGSPRPPRRTTPHALRRPSADASDARRADLPRMEQAAIEAGRWLRRTGRVSLPVRTRPRGGGAAPRSD